MLQVLEADLVRTCSRLGTGRDRMAALRIWGDHAEYHTRDSLGLIMFSVMTGKVRRRFLICGFSKRSQCRCGCKGQCTFQTVWDVIECRSGRSSQSDGQRDGTTMCCFRSRLCQGIASGHNVLGRSSP